MRNASVQNLLKIDKFENIEDARTSRGKVVQFLQAKVPHTDLKPEENNQKSNIILHQTNAHVINEEFSWPQVGILTSICAIGFL